MERKILVVGDPPALGGRVLPYDGPMFGLYGHRIALIGGRAYCEGCNSVGIIAKAGGPRRLQFISEAALEGDVVICHCPMPQPLLATLQHTSTYDDGAWYAAGAEPSVAAMAMLVAAAPSEMAALKKVVDAGVAHPAEAEQTENICPNMTNKELVTTVLELRDKAVSLISGKRLPELERWNEADRSRVKDWFGVADQSTREYMQQGLKACVQVLRGLDARNFVRYSETALKHVGCILPSNADDAAAGVCKPDTATHTIAINIKFCALRPISADQDSKLSTLIHEVTHFNDCFGSFDALYYLRSSREAAKTDPQRMRSNADSIAGYVVWDEVFHAR
ncbi:M35 family metallo-endopeptidase [Variovorax sp. Varisp85]|uniref:M35 family metallo-endopeptidase n=1 Tax=Variovorax sp. Varisp85 TaxID=3243059 RepID=UPI0039A77A34